MVDFNPQRADQPTPQTVITQAMIALLEECRRQNFHVGDDVLAARASEFVTQLFTSPKAPLTMEVCLGEIGRLASTTISALRNDVQNANAHGSQPNQTGLSGAVGAAAGLGLATGANANARGTDAKGAERESDRREGDSGTNGRVSGRTSYDALIAPPGAPMSYSIYAQAYRGMNFNAETISNFAKLSIDRGTFNELRSEGFKRDDIAKSAQDVQAYIKTHSMADAREHFKNDPLRLRIIDHVSDDMRKKGIDPATADAKTMANYLNQTPQARDVLAKDHQQNNAAISAMSGQQVASVAVTESAAATKTAAAAPSHPGATKAVPVPATMTMHL